MSIINYPECYEVIVGLTRTECQCFEGYQPEYSNSQSGLYLDELTGLSFLKSIVNCDGGFYSGMYDIMKQARDIAIMNFQADSNALLSERFRPRRNTYQGSVGRVNSQGGTLANGKYYGIRIRCDKVRGGSILLSGIGTYFKTTGTVDVTVYDNLGNDHGTYTLNTQAGKHHRNTLPSAIELPTSSNYLDNIEYYIVYQYDTVNEPNINDIKCSCGSFKPKFHCERPYYHHRTAPNDYGWGNWFMVGGVDGNDDTDFSNMPDQASNNLYGLTLDLHVRCRVGEVLCGEQFDFVGNPMAGAVALAIQHKAGELLAGYILRSGELNRFTIINTEQLQEDAAKFKETYNRMVQYISETAEISNNDCLMCKDVFEIARRGIFA